MSSANSPKSGAVPSQDGSEVRWFAGLAMQAIIAKQPSVPDTQVEREEIALWAYRMGQAMVQTEARLRVVDSPSSPPQSPAD